MKDHEIRETVSRVQELCFQFRDSQQLRERIANFLVPVLKAALTPSDAAGALSDVRIPMDIAIDARRMRTLRRLLDAMDDMGNGFPGAVHAAFQDGGESTCRALDEVAVPEDLISAAPVAPAAVAPSEAKRFDAVELILRDVCEDEPADPEQNDTVCINASDLKTILDRHIGSSQATAALLEWAIGRWNAEVAHRPLVNVHRRSLDDTWRQVIRRCGADDVALLGPKHGDLVTAAPTPIVAADAGAPSDLWELIREINGGGALPITVQHMNAAARDVLAERARQVSEEGWTPEHDEKYRDHEMSCAAGCYAMYTLAFPAGDPPPAWPWAADWWKPTTHRRNLIKAGALILAEIERIDRAGGEA